MYTSTRCDKQEHGTCDGTCTYIDQDGSSRYECECFCHAEVRRRHRQENALRDVRRLMDANGVSSTHELVEKALALPTEGER